MKKFLIPFATVAVLGAMLSLKAHDDGEESEKESKFKAKIKLGATAEAPAGASGKAEIEAEEDDGIFKAEVEFEVKGLAAGDYVLSIVRASDFSSIQLGQFTVAAKEEDDDDDDGEDENEGDLKSDDNDDGEFEGEVELPSEVDPADVAQIVVSDTGGTTLLIGDLQTGAGLKLNYRAKVAVQAGEAAPDAHGKASIKIVAKQGKRVERFFLLAKGLPASTLLTVRVNGEDVTQVTTTKKGKVLVKKLPVANLSQAQTVELVDPQGNVLGTANF